MTFAAVSAMTITLTLVAGFLAVTMNANKLAHDMQKNVTVSVFIESNVSNQEIKDTQKKIEAIPNVEKVKFSSKQEEYKKMVKQMGESFDVFTEDDNPLYNVFFVSVKNPRNTSTVQKQVKKVPHVIQATYGGKNAEKILKMSDKIKKWGIVLTLILLVISMFLISNTIRLTILSRQNDIKIMRLVGATKGYIRWPFIFEGIWVGILGSIIPLLVVGIGYPFVYNAMNPSLVAAHYQMLTLHQVFAPITCITLLSGIVVAVLGTTLSMRRFLKA